MSFAARRAKPRKITVAASDSESSDDRPKRPTTLSVRKKLNVNISTSSATAAATAAEPSAQLAPLPFPRPRKKPTAATRLSFGGDSTDADTSEPAFTPKKAALSRKAVERNAAKRALELEKLSISPAERVTYSKEYLEELRNAQKVATPDLPAMDDDVVMVDLDEAQAADVHMAEAGGPSAVAVVGGGGGVGIMDEGVVRVMKARRKERATAAKAEDFISLHDDASDEGGRNEIMLRPRQKKESRLARPEDFNDDEEIANYVEDEERVLLTNSKSARREQERKRKQAIRATIAEAEGADDEGAESDVSRDSLVEEWERDQIRKGAFSNNEHVAKGLEGELEALARNPPTVTALPDIGDVVARLVGTMRAMEIRKAQTEQQIRALELEKRQIKEREDMVQTRLKEAAVQYEKLRKETGIGGGGAGPEGVADRGLESFGNTPIRVTVEE